jgi:hypothetical protein
VYSLICFVASYVATFSCVSEKFIKQLAWWLIPVIPVTQEVYRQEDLKFEISMDRASKTLSLKQNKNKRLEVWLK